MTDPVTPTIVPAMKLLLMALDFVGTFVFALSGAIAAVKRELDFFGVLVLAFVAATTGGIIRDVLIGAIPRPRWSTGATSRSRSWRES